MGDDYHFSDCLYDDAVTRTMVIFSIIPCEIFTVFLMMKFTGEKQSWLSVVKMLNHFVIVVCLISTEHGLIKSLLKIEETNNNMMCVVVDMIILIIVDIPDLPYPFDFIMLSMDIMFICFTLWNHGNGAQVYHLVKNVCILLLGIWYIVKREKARFKIQKILYKEIKGLHKYKEFLDSMPEGLAIINEQAEVIFSNKSLTSMLDTKEIDITLRKLKNNQWFQKESKQKRRELEHSWLAE
jgi:PAS domain-containing protein